MQEKEYAHYLNVGCGKKYDKRMTNIDFVGNDDVQTHNLLHGLPYADDSFSVVYLSQVIEHFTQEQALGLLKECHRVMKKGGVIRLATPDLEETARLYLEALASYQAEASPENKAAHDWYVIELIDQSVRNQTEGEMGRVLRQPNNVHHHFLLKRVGHIAQVLQQAGPEVQTSQPLTVKRRIKNALKALKQWRTLFLSAEDKENLCIGRFRRGGEIHYWLYDGLSLGDLLTEAGFAYPQRHNPHTSQVADWTQFHLDVKENGLAYDPHSLFIEAVK